MTDIAESAEIDKASALRILEVMCDEGLVERDATKIYRYGEGAHAIAAALSRSRSLESIARPVLEELSRACGDTVLLLIRRGDESVCIDRITGDFPIQASSVKVGTRLPLGGGAGSLALIAWLDDSEAESVLRLNTPRLERYQGLKISTIRTEMHRARERGYTVFFDVFIKGVGALAVPVRGADGRPLAAITVESISTRIAERESVLAKKISGAARHVENELNAASAPISGTSLKKKSESHRSRTGRST